LPTSVIFYYHHHHIFSNHGKSIVSIYFPFTLSTMIYIAHHGLIFEYASSGFISWHQLSFSRKEVYWFTLPYFNVNLGCMYGNHHFPPHSSGSMMFYFNTISHHNVSYIVIVVVYYFGQCPMYCVGTSPLIVSSLWFIPNNLGNSHHQYSCLSLHAWGKVVIYFNINNYVLNIFGKTLLIYQCNHHFNSQDYQSFIMT